MVETAGETAPPRLARADGAAAIGWQLGRGVAVGAPAAERRRATALARCAQRPPCRVLVPAGETDDPPAAVLLTTTGGLTGGDRVAIAVDAGAGTIASVTSQAAEKLYRARAGERPAAIAVRLSVGPGAWLEWLPQETIVFDGAALDRYTELRLDPGEGSGALAVEILMFGRRASGERLRRGAVFDGWRVSRGERPVWADGLALDGDIASVLDDPMAFDGAAALATIVLVVDRPERWRDCAREWCAGAGTAVAAGATLVNGVIVCRMVGRDAAAVRSGAAAWCMTARHVVAGLPARMPRAWML